MPPELFKVLLVEDDEDDYFLTRSLFAEIKGNRYKIDWISTFAAKTEWK